jgi:hypothetical protein
VSDEPFLFRVTVELRGWESLRLVPGIRSTLIQDQRVLRYVKGWPWHMRMVRRQIHPHLTIEVAASDQREAIKIAQSAVTDALQHLGADAEAAAWIVSTDWERA